MKIGYQLKQVRERLQKGLVDKGILRTERRNFLLFDMATHPVADGGAKDELRKRVRNVLTNRTVVIAPSQFLPQEVEYRYLRTITMVCAAYAANVLENALATLGHEARERAFAQVDELLAEYSQWPFGKRTGQAQGIGANLGGAITEELNKSGEKELQMEVSLVEAVSSACMMLMGFSTGGGSMSERLHAPRLAPVNEDISALSSTEDVNLISKERERMQCRITEETEISGGARRSHDQTESVPRRGAACVVAQHQQSRKRQKERKRNGLLIFFLFIFCPTCLLMCASSYHFSVMGSIRRCCCWDGWTSERAAGKVERGL